MQGSLSLAPSQPVPVALLSRKQNTALLCIAARTAQAAPRGGPGQPLAGAAAGAHGVQRVCAARGLSCIP